MNDDMNTGSTTDPNAGPSTGARRSRKKVVIASVAVVAVLAAAVGLVLFQPWKLFTRSTVDESFPVAASAPMSAPMSDHMSDPMSAPLSDPMSAPMSDPMSAPMSDPMSDPMSAAVSAPALPPTTEAAAAPPAQVTTAAAAEPVALASGTFVDGEHPTSGTATIFQLPDGSRVLRLENFSTSDGPDVDVALSDQSAGGDDWGKYDDSRYIGLGDLKGTDGNQNYAIPADVDLSGLTSVVIWCDRFNVAFGTAAISV